MRLDTFLVSLLLGIMFISGGLILINGTGEEKGLMTAYNVTITETIFENISQERDLIYQNASAMKDDIAIEDITSDSAWDNAISGALKAVGNFWGFIRSAGRLVHSLGIMIGVPGELLTLFFVILLVLSIFSIIYMIFRFMPR